VAHFLQALHLPEGTRRLRELGERPHRILEWQVSSRVEADWVLQVGVQAEQGVYSHVRQGRMAMRDPLLSQGLLLVEGGESTELLQLLPKLPPKQRLPSQEKVGEEDYELFLEQL